MASNQAVIKVKPIFVLFIILFTMAGFIALIMTWNYQANKYIKLTPEMKIDTTEITGDEKFGVLRGAVFFDNGYFIDTSAKLVVNSCKRMDWKSNGPLFDLHSKPHEYTLTDLGLPYTVYKKANEDTLHVEKDGCVLKFLIQ